VQAINAHALRAVATVTLCVAFLALLSGSAGASALYVTKNVTKEVAVFRIGADGALSPLPCSPAGNCATGSNPNGLAIDPSGRHLYVPNYASDTISVYSIAADGSLSPIACPPANCTPGDGPLAIAIDPAGRYLYVTNDISQNVSAFAIAADGTLAPIPCNPVSKCAAGTAPKQPAIDPSGRHLYVVDDNADSVLVFAIGPGGELSPLPYNPAANCATGDLPFAATVEPSGHYLYVANDFGGLNGNSVSVFAIAADGSLSPVACNPTTDCATGGNPQSLAADPSGRYVYVANSGSNDITPFRIGPTGALTHIGCTPASNCATGNTPYGIAVDPLGRHLYAGNNVSADISPFAIDAGGGLSPISCNPISNCAASAAPNNWSVVVSPDRGPVAALTATAAPAGSPSSFDGSSSTSPDYAITNYLWTFGDGQTQAGSPSPKAQHTYTKPGTYTVTLTVTDEAGCSTAVIYTGQTASCNGSAKAVASGSVTVAPGLARISRLRVSPSAFPAAPSGPTLRTSKRKVGAIVSYRDSQAARTTFTVQRRAPGRRQGHRCVKPRKRNRRGKPCTRFVSVGSFRHKDVAGTNRFRFTGRVRRHKLAPGRYRLRAIPRTAAGSGKPAFRGFRVKR
jgi:6-phosphogluconolactonase (cycloisomerase 2 family)